MKNRQTAKIIKIKRKIQEVILINNYRFIKSIIIDMATGEMNKRRRCPVCGRKKNPHAWICLECVETASQPTKLIAAAKKAVVQFGGKIKSKNQSHYPLTLAEKNKIKQIAKDWIKEHPEATLEKFIKTITNLSPCFCTPSQTQALEKILTAIHNKYQKEREYWNRAQELARRWLDDHPYDINRPAVDIADNLITFLASKGKLIRAVTKEQKKRRLIVKEKAKEIAKEYWLIFPEDNRPPKKIAEKLMSIIPIEILAQALSQEKEKILAQRRKWLDTLIGHNSHL
jgi:hypothetical protein